MSLKTNQNFTKRSKTKTRNQKNKDRSWNLKTLGDNFEILHGKHDFQGEEREKCGKKKAIGDKPYHLDHTRYPLRKRTWQWIIVDDGFWPVGGVVRVV
jgi:hypothetical protein